MQYTSENDKELIRHNVHRYVHEGLPLTITQYSRLMQWLNGMTFDDIAVEESVSSQAIGASVKIVAEAIKTFAETHPSGTLFAEHKGKARKGTTK